MTGKEWGVKDEYWKSVETSCENNESIEIPNPSLNHAKLLIFNLFRKAERSIKIFSGNLDEDLYGTEEIQNAMKSIKDDVTVEVVVDCKPQSNIYNKDKKVVPNKLEEGWKGRERIPGHFMVVDGMSYRFEKNHKLGNNSQIKGVANFNDTGVASSMEFVFDKILMDNSHPCQ